MRTSVVNAHQYIMVILQLQLQYLQQNFFPEIEVHKQH